MKANSILCLECPECGSEPDGNGLGHLFGCSKKLEVSAGDGTVERVYVAEDALLTREAILAFVEAVDGAPVVRWDEDVPWTEQDYSEQEAGMRAAIAHVIASGGPLTA